MLVLIVYFLLFVSLDNIETIMKELGTQSISEVTWRKVAVNFADGNRKTHKAPEEASKKERNEEHAPANAIRRVGVSQGTRPPLYKGDHLGPVGQRCPCRPEMPALVGSQPGPILKKHPRSSRWMSRVAGVH